MTGIPAVLAISGVVWAGVGLSVLLAVLGALYVRTGIRNVKGRVAEERGRARMTNDLLGRSNAYTGRKAVLLGWIRIIGGALAVVFGIIMIFVWLFLPER